MKFGVTLRQERNLVLSFSGKGDFVGECFAVGCSAVGCSAVGYSGVQDFWVVYFDGGDVEEGYFAVGDFVMGDFEVGNLAMRQVLADWVLEVPASPVICSEAALVGHSATEE